MAEFMAMVVQVVSAAEPFTTPASEVYPVSYRMAFSPACPAVWLFTFASLLPTIRHRSLACFSLSF